MTARQIAPVQQGDDANAATLVSELAAYADFGSGDASVESPTT